ncbi:MAG: 6-carboxyhexanoate--CoA ligase [Fibrobacter sp.]|nr:6-carboxyhexanoate--CoA ligase [Fibrobacter sp.]
MDYYSLKMRASQQVLTGSEKKEQHISGAERIVTKESVEDVCKAMIRRAMTHSKGEPDFINVKIEKIQAEDIQVLKALPVTRVDVNSAEEGLNWAYKLLRDAVVENGAELTAMAIEDFTANLKALLRETFPMRGAMLYDIATGTRLEPDRARGVRATYMDALHSSEVDGKKNHFNEAIVLATKVANAPGIVAELCISDDPNYVTGYVASKTLGYVRIMKMKEMNDENGGRIFLFDSRKASAVECIQYLQQQKVLVEL